MSDLTGPQWRELANIAKAGDGGLFQGGGPPWKVRDRLRQLGLADLRSVPYLYPDGFQRQQCRWFLTDAGRAATLHIQERKS